MQKSLSGNLKNSFFGSVLYCLFFQVNWLTEDNKTYKDKAEENLGKEFYDKFKEKKEVLQLDDSLENVFQKFHIANDVLEIKGLFLRVYERHD